MQFQVTRLCPGRPKGDSQGAQGSEAGVKPDRMRALEQPQTHPAATTCPSPTLEELARNLKLGIRELQFRVQDSVATQIVPQREQEGNVCIGHLRRIFLLVLAVGNLI